MDKRYARSLIIALVAHILGIFFFQLPKMMVGRSAASRKFTEIEYREEEEKKKKEEKKEEKKLLTPKTPTVSVKDKLDLMKEKMKIPEEELRKLASIAQPLKMTEKLIDIGKMIDAHKSQAFLDLNQFEQLDVGSALGNLEVIRVGKGMRTEDILKEEAIALPKAALSGAQVGLFTTPGAAVSGGGGQVELEKATKAEFEEKRETFAKQVKKITPQKVEGEVESGPKTEVEITGALADRKMERMVLPPYPEWAQKQGLSAYLNIMLKVGPNGRVTGTVITVSTTGFPQWDNMVINWIKNNWVWESVPGLTSPGNIGIRFIIG